VETPYHPALHGPEDNRNKDDSKLIETLKSFKVEDTKIKDFDWKLLKMDDKLRDNEYDAIITPGELPRNQYFQG
jgi:hypothetical protein